MRFLHCEQADFHDDFEVLQLTGPHIEARKHWISGYPHCCAPLSPKKDEGRRGQVFVTARKLACGPVGLTLNHELV